MRPRLQWKPRDAGKAGEAKRVSSVNRLFNVRSALTRTRKADSGLLFPHS